MVYTALNNGWLELALTAVPLVYATHQRKLVCLLSVYSLVESDLQFFARSHHTNSCSRPTDEQLSPLRLQRKFEYCN